MVMTTAMTPAKIGRVMKKLEALRRAAVHARHRGFALPTAEIAHFHSVGFSEAQLETLITSVTGMRVGRTDRRIFA